MKKTLIIILVVFSVATAIGIIISPNQKFNCMPGKKVKEIHLRSNYQTSYSDIEYILEDNSVFVSASQTYQIGECTKLK